MNETAQLKKLMEAIEDADTDQPEVQITNHFAKVIADAKAYYETEYSDEDEVLEMIDEAYKAGLSRVYGSEF